MPKQFPKMAESSKILLVVVDLVFASIFVFTCVIPIDRVCACVASENQALKLSLFGVYGGLSPLQRPLSCCFVRKGGPGPGEREKRQRAGNASPRAVHYSKISHREPLRRRECGGSVAEWLGRRT